MSEEMEISERESMEFDVVIVGAGPAGLSAAIKLKQLNSDLEVVVLEKGPEVGAHILSGAVVDPIAVDRLFPDWRDEDGHPFKTPVKDDIFYFLTKGGKLRLPNFGLPPLMNNHGNYIVSLGNVCRWLAEKAEGLGVEIYPGFAAAELIYDDNGNVKGVATGDMGLQKDGTPGPMHERGMELHGKYVLFGEGARGSLSKELIARFDLAKDSEPAKFGIGLKELWEVDPAKHKQGLVQHSFGWPLDKATGRRVIPLSPGRQSGCRWICTASELQKPVFVTLSGISAVQNPSGNQGYIRRRKAHLLWFACDYRRRVSERAKTFFPRWGVDGLCCGFCKRAAHQGLT